MKQLFFVFAAMILGFSAQASMSDYAGTYYGSFDNTHGALTIAVSGSVMSASFAGGPEAGSDILGGGCGSTIGKMTDIDMDGNEVDHVTFAFDPGACAMNYAGREIVLDFSHKNGVPTKVSVSLYSRTESQPTNECHPDSSGGLHCWPGTNQIVIYAEGSFKK